MPRARASTMLRALRHDAYRRYTAAGLVSVTGTWMQVVAQNWLVLRLTGHAATVGVVVALQALPTVVLGLLGGSIADRLPKRSLLVVTQMLLAGLACVLGIAAATGVASVTLICVLALALGAVLAVDGPAGAAFGAELVPAEDLPNAIALGSVTNSIGRIAGMALAGALVGAVGESAVFWLNGLSYLTVVAILWRIESGELREVDRPAPDNASVSAGLRVALQSRTIVVATVVAFFVTAFGRNYQVTMAAMSRSVFATGARGYGALSVVFAAGALVGGLIATVLRRHSLRLLVSTAGAAAMLQLVSSIAPSFRVFATCIAPIAVTAVVFDTMTLSVVQLGVGDAHRARTIALLGTATMLGTTAGGPALGWLADNLGARASLALGAVVVLGGTACASAVAQWWRRRAVPTVRDEVSTMDRVRLA